MDSGNVEIYNALHDLYEVLHPQREDELSFYRSLVRESGEVALDVACGTGVVTAELVRAGARVTGLDGSEKMLEHARARLPNVEWVNGDMRSFVLGAKFDLVVCACNSLQHMNSCKDAVAALSCIGRHMTPEARFVFDVFNPAWEYLSSPRRNILVRNFKGPDDVECELREDTNFDRRTSLLHINWRVLDAKTQTVLRSASTYMLQIFPEEMDTLVESSGFSIEDKFGDFHRSRFHDSAPKQILVLRQFP
jgi:ubiquinone/menaquinone biosynthesis C-methylase UbiE